jgi:fructose-bisphosphate aldolase class II
MVSFKELGLSNTKEMFRKALKGHYAVPGYNFNNMEQLQAIITACVETKSPVILQVSEGARKYANQTLLRYMAQGAVAFAKELGYAIPICLHLDHGANLTICKSCVDFGFSSVMYDGSGLPYEENIKISKQVVEYARARDVSVECELGVLKGKEDEVTHDVAHYTRPEEVQDFVSKTECDSLAISIGTSHGAYKFKIKSGQSATLRLDILEEVKKRLPNFPIVLHGSSSVPQDLVAIVNKYGGKMGDTAGVPEDQLRKAAMLNVTKINIDTDGRIAMTAAIRKALAEHPDWFDPRQYLGPARQSLIDLYKRKNKDVLGSAGQA